MFFWYRGLHKETQRKCPTYDLQTSPRWYYDAVIISPVSSNLSYYKIRLSSLQACHALSSSCLACLTWHMLMWWYDDDGDDDNPYCDTKKCYTKKLGDKWLNLLNYYTALPPPPDTRWETRIHTLNKRISIFLHFI